MIVTCEHGGNRVPARYRGLFEGAGPVLATHRGWDIGALGLARTIAAALNAPLFFSTTTRLLVDLNRSVGRRGLFSDFTRALVRDERDRILAEHYHPYRERVERWIARAAARGVQVLHLSVHSFTPVLNGEVRRADVGLLYDPARPGERRICDAWRRALAASGPWRVRRNYPYLGVSDGLVTSLRRRFAPGEYVGVELEVNQKHLAPRSPTGRGMRAAVVRSLVGAVAADTRSAR